MPPLERTDRKQLAVLWPRLLDAQGRVRSDGEGNPLVATTPQEIKVRWVWKRAEVFDKDGNTVSIDATAVIGPDVKDAGGNPTAEVPIGSAMWLGGLDDLPGTGLVPETDVMTVVAAPTTPDIKNRNVRRTLMLKRSKDALPTKGS